MRRHNSRTRRWIMRELDRLMDQRQRSQGGQLSGRYQTPSEPLAREHNRPAC